MFKLYFLAGVMTEEALEDYKDTIEQLKNGEWSSLSFEKLRGHLYVYSVRSNHKARLLISFPVLNGERSLVILEALPNHEYTKSRVLRSGLIQHYITDFKQSVDNPEFEPIDMLDEVKQMLPEIPDSSSSSSSSAIIKPVHYYFSSYIEHSTEQAQAIEIKAPQLITGPSGSGKSCVALAKARALYNVMNRLDEEFKTITYIAPLKSLCTQVELSFKATLPENAVRNVNVNFLTAKEWSGVAAQVTVVGFEAFEKALDNAKGITHLKACHQLQSLVQPKNKNRKMHLQKIYTELQLIAVHTEQDYVDLGIRESLYANKDMRQELLVLFKYYLQYLTSKNLCDLGLNSQSFFKPSVKAKGLHYVLVDEAQSISPMILKLLITNYGSNSYFFADSNQNTETMLSILPFLRKWLVQSGLEKVTLTTSRLEICYRCPEAIAVAANWVLKLKQHLTQGITDKSETVEVLPIIGALIKGKVNLIQPQATSLSALKEQLAEQQLRCAVIAPPSSIIKAKLTFPDWLVFTVQEIRGLQFEHIIAYELFSTKEMQALNDKLRQLKNEDIIFDPNAGKDYQYLPKKDAANEIRFNPELNGLFITFTRAMKSLWIVEDYEKHAYEFTAKSLYDYLYSALPRSQPVEEGTQKPLEYLELVKQLLMNANEAQAQQIFLKYHQGDQNDFEHLKQHLYLAERFSSNQDVSADFSFNNVSLINTNESSSTSLSNTRRKHHSHTRLKDSSIIVASNHTAYTAITAKINTKPIVATLQTARSKIYRLSRTEIGCAKLFKKFQKSNVDIYELCAIDPEEQVPALYWIARNHEGVTWLNKLSEEQIQGISAKAMCVIHPNHKVPALYWLARSANGIAWLSKLSENQIKQLDPKVFYLTYSNMSLTQIKLPCEPQFTSTSMFNNLTKSKEGLTLLRRLAQCNPNLPKPPTDSYLAHLQHLNIQDDSLSILQNSQIGRELLDKFLVSQFSHKSTNDIEPPSSKGNSAEKISEHNNNNIPPKPKLY